MRGSEWSKRRKTKEKSDKEDRFSALPEEVIHHVFSFLDMREVVKTCLLSNKWRYLWMSAPTVSFDNEEIVCDFPSCCNCGLEYCECEACLSGSARFRYFVSKVLTLGSSKLVKIKLNDSYQVRPAIVNKWINAVLARSVQDIDLSTTVTKTLILPHDLFTTNLRVLKLSCDAKMPNSIAAAVWIKQLDLVCVELPDGNTNGELFLKFPVLESLRLVRCDVSHLKLISISTPILESMEFIRIRDGQSSSCVVKTCTPSLKFLKLYEYKTRLSVETLGNYCMEDLSSLVSAEIFFHSDSAAELVEDCRKCWFEAVSWLYNVQSLKLPISSIQIMLDSPKLLERLPGVFCNLKHVMLDMDGRKTFSTKALLKFLERTPNIETLVLQGQDPNWYTPVRFEEEEDEDPSWYTPDRFEAEEEEWVGEEWISLPPFNHMVSFEIQNFNGLHDEMKFLEFVLKNAIVLEKMVIKTKKEWLQGKSKEDIFSFPRASSTLSMVFQITELSPWELRQKRYLNIM